jgi:hypothetical protein
MPLYVLFLNFDIVVDEMVVFAYRRKAFASTLGMEAGTLVAAAWLICDE